MRNGWLSGAGACMVVAALLPSGLAADGVQGGDRPPGGQGPEPAVPGQAQAAVSVDTARVGDVVPLTVRVATEPGERVVWPDTLPLQGSEVENAARVTERIDTLGGGRLVRRGVYAVTPWRTGALQLPELTVSVVADDGTARTVRVAGPTLTVASVLPADTAGLEPRPAKMVVGPSWAWTTIALVVLLAATVVGALIWWWRRRGGGREKVLRAEPPVPPRERALAALQAAREAGLLERGEVKEFYTRFSGAVRDYVAALEPTWGEDLTTTELLARFRAQVGPSASASLGRVLAPTDQVKFARREPDADTAMAEWEAAREWVLTFDWPPRPVAPVEEAA